MIEKLKTIVTNTTVDSALEDNSLLISMNQNRATSIVITIIEIEYDRIDVQENGISKKGFFSYRQKSNRLIFLFNDISFVRSDGRRIIPFSFYIRMNSR